MPGKPGIEEKQENENPDQVTMGDSRNPSAYYELDKVSRDLADCKRMAGYSSQNITRANGDVQNASRDVGYLGQRLNDAII
ncbi:MAG: hypothetical protein ACLFQV_09550 [Vulcanimicrobiota bacterium]